MVACGGIRQGGVDVERELRRAPWAYRLFGRVLVDVPWFLVNPRDRLQGDPASRLVHFVSDTRPRRVIAQLLCLSASLFCGSSLSSYQSLLRFARLVSTCLAAFICSFVSLSLIVDNPFFSHRALTRISCPTRAYRLAFDLRRKGTKKNEIKDRLDTILRLLTADDSAIFRWPGVEAVRRANLWEGRSDFSNNVLLLARYRFNRGATRERNEELLMRGFINKIIITISGRAHFSTSCNDARETRGFHLRWRFRYRGIVCPALSNRAA